MVEVVGVYEIFHFEMFKNFMKICMEAFCVSFLGTCSFHYQVSNIRKFKNREVAQPQKNDVITGFIKSLVLNTLIIFMDASATGRLEWCTTVCLWY